MESISEQEGVVALAEFLAAKYYSPLQLQIQKRIPKLDDGQIRDFVCEVMYELIKNDYRGIQRLDRNRGHFRGLLFKILERLEKKAFSKNRVEISLENLGDFSEDCQQAWTDVCLDLQEVLQTLQKERPLLYKPFTLYYLEGKNIREIAELVEIKENAVKQRLHSARCWIATKLPGDAEFFGKESC